MKVARVLTFQPQGALSLKSENCNPKKLLPEARNLRGYYE